MWFQYVWIVACGALLALFVAYGIGANDVANAFATSVGGKSLTIRQALLVAAVCEFSGAVLLGSKVTSTVRKGIADYHAFLEAPELLMYGMLCVLLATGLWLVISCYFELPVSTTHSVIGGIIGMAVTAEGWKAVNWYQSSSRFPYVEGVVAIVISWIVSPVLSGLLSTALFGSVRYLVLRAENSYDRSWYVLPLLVFVTVLVNVFFIIFKGASGRLSLSLATSVWVSFLVGAVATLVVGAVIIPLLKRKVRHNLPDSTAGGEEHVEHQDEPQELKGQAVEIELPTEGQQNTTPTVLLTSESKGSSAWSRITSSLGQGVNYNVHGPVETDKTVHDIHDLSERFDPKTEQSFKYLQVFTAICDSFSHGANDVANSVGPFAAIWGIYINDGIKAEAQVPVWILALGGVGIVIGLATYGYKIMCAIGVKMCRITASRGFAIELGAAIVIVVGSQLGIPLSTTHCQVGATVGVGLLEGSRGVNWPLVGKVIVGWVITLIVTALTTAAFFAQGVFAPSIINIRERTTLQHSMESASSSMVTALGQPPYLAPELAQSLQHYLETLGDMTCDPLQNRYAQAVPAGDSAELLASVTETALSTLVPASGGEWPRASEAVCPEAQ